jgi:site-specific DNA-methyltransferase (adenine-specific)
VKPYYADEQVTLYLGDMREVLPALGQFDCAVTDPPYAETSLSWDRWPDGWPSIVAEHTSSMWCFGSIRMFLDRRDEFFVWKLSQDVVWDKGIGTSLTNDRFRRAHEHALHWYRGAWGEVHHDTPREGQARPGRAIRRAASSAYTQGARGYSEYLNDGTRLMHSVIPAPNLVKRALHPTEKPSAVLGPLIRYACPVAGTVLDPFAGSGSTAVAARMSGRRSVLIEGHEPYCEAIARRLAQDVLPIGAP